VVTAAAQDQWRLLDVQGHDTRLAQISHRSRTLPEHAEVDRSQVDLSRIADQLVLARVEAGDIARELAKAEADVEQVRQRAARDRSRMDSGQGTPKDLQALQHELVTLAQRQSVLEDAELEVMERQEATDARVRQIEAEQQRVRDGLAEVTARRDRQLAELAAEATEVGRAREQSAAGVPAELIALYERIRSHAGGVGAARLYQRRCEGCRLELNNTDLGNLRTAAENSVIRCEECGRILIRTPDSGL
jgi:predicted  nucleic acid-binding Zn-ribbon protein